MNALMAALILSSLASGGEMEDVRSNLISTVRYLSEEVGERSYLQPGNLEKAALYIEEKFRSYGLSVEGQALTYRGNRYHNIIAEVKGREGSDGILVIGAHYDTVIGTPGADDNASGVATLLENSGDSLLIANPSPSPTKPLLDSRDSLSNSNISVG